ncbi:MAG: hypothetical protein ABGW91_01765 [Christiangramia sp.]|uniref:Uncharacterized protein n=1 Tax=Christiangramia flava JLT2011 TaxID=1229726 RepID=A0A1L7I5A5_9FLAO|nr:hypothetical protein [Christiangramia flava]APU68781.1 hypothetical protein GRFL_2057 [Christiangramia flava JLT2011]OSS39074.1 hypothetical protein C723_2080 [Christiangramia flava JLT2011]|tara:strand:- start:225 stop:464 length:240 start_codon:yes stop_codon:yes gene_type:complete
MKRTLLSISLGLAIAAGFTSCRDTEEKETKTIVREVEVEKAPDTVVKEREGILERTAKEVDKEVNKEIDKQIDNIGDDN